MVKDEDDIIDIWIKYHGSLFGYNNLYIVDNFSTDNTYNIILKYKNKGVNIYREKDYKQKGDIMKKLINNCNKNLFDICYPIDIDEFIVYYNKNTKTLNPNYTLNYINNILKNKLNSYDIFKTNYIQTLITKENSIKNYGYKNAPLECKYGDYADYKDVAKTFLMQKN